MTNVIRFPAQRTAPRRAALSRSVVVFEPRQPMPLWRLWSLWSLAAFTFWAIVLGGGR